ncbi:MAG: hypothetical protein ABSE73_16905 [Planctomycetota bacterium]
MPATARDYHVCLASDIIERTPDLLKIVHDAGVSAVWIGAFLYGHWPYPLDLIRRAKAAVEKEGLRAHLINVPLGHPGDSLGAAKGDVPLTPPQHWRMGVTADGRRHSGTSLHEPATSENVKALAALSALGPADLFLDDDFRLAISPGMVGGCYCDEHKDAYRKAAGVSEQQWDGLRDDARARRLTPALRAFLDYCCDELTASFHAQQAAWPGGRLGAMVMYFGAEKAGIRLSDYKNALLRVGECHFDDGSFGSVKGKCDELFSVLFHRRFVAPERAFSETTAYPANRLSAANMAAKLAVSTLSDTRHSMFMSGLTPFPVAHWATLKPAMKKHAALHARLAGHAPAGPFKHFWGEPSRYVGDDNPFSLFLASGVPFAVCDAPAADGWTFLSNQDAAAAAAGTLKSAGSVFVQRGGPGMQPDGGRVLGEKFEDLLALKRELMPQLKGTPLVLEDKPAVLAWYPTADLALVWNLSPQPETLTVRREGSDRQVRVAGLDVEAVDWRA